MCARYTLHASADLLAQLFGLPAIPPLSPRYNISPSQEIAVIGSKAGGGRGLAMFRWGFVPHWANDPNSGPKPVNAKSEGMAENAAFRESVRKRRCLIPADGFYEWRTTADGKRPLHFRRRDRGLFAFAGLWDCWRGNDKPLFTCTIVTTASNALVRPVHDRMPVILPREHWAQWLDPNVADPEQLLPLTAPYEWDEMEAVSVNPVVNSSRHEGPDCLQEVPMPNEIDFDGAVMTSAK